MTMKELTPLEKFASLFDSPETLNDFVLDINRMLEDVIRTCKVTGSRKYNCGAMSLKINTPSGTADKYILSIRKSLNVTLD